MPDGSRGAFIANVVTEARRALCRADGYRAARDTHHAVWDTVPRGMPCRADAYYAVVWDAVARGTLKRSKWILPLHLSPEHSRVLLSTPEYPWRLAARGT